MPNSIGVAGEDYGAKGIVSQEQKDKIRKFWEQVPQALKDAIKQSHCPASKVFVSGVCIKLTSGRRMRLVLVVNISNQDTVSN